jgi:hypothetical protein
MTGTVAGTDFGTLASQTTLNVVEPAHPLAAGLSGLVTVTRAARTISFGVPNANAVAVARPNGSATRAVIFGYERGAVMPGRTAPGRRVGFFFENTTANALTGAGWSLFDAAVRWVSGR